MLFFLQRNVANVPILLVPSCLYFLERQGLHTDSSMLKERFVQATVLCPATDFETCMAQIANRRWLFECNAAVLVYSFLSIVTGKNRRGQAWGQEVNLCLTNFNTIQSRAGINCTNGQAVAAVKHDNLLQAHSTV